MTRRLIQECTRCVMDSEAAGAVFDSEGRCNYCTDMLIRLGSYQASDPVELERRLKSFTATIREAGKGKRYDCIVGVSGGADSAYALYLARQHDLRPLAVHMDNGWNSELAVNNIENLVRKLGVDLYTHVVDWREYRALQNAFFDADVIDVELLYDNAMLDTAWDLVKDWSFEERLRLNEAVHRSALATPVRRYRVQDLARELIDIAEAGLVRQNCRDARGETEAIYLERARDDARRGRCPADLVLERWKAGARDAAELVALTAYRLPAAA